MKHYDAGWAFTTMRLLFGRVRVGKILEPFFSDQNWYGGLLLAPSIADEAAGRRIRTYKNVCEDWNEREEVYDNPDSPPDASEFDEYRDLTESDELRIQNEVDGSS